MTDRVTPEIEALARRMVIDGAKALLRDRLGILAAQANDATVDRAAHDADIVISALIDCGHIGTPAEDR